MTRDAIEQKLTELRQQRDQLLAHANVAAGMVIAYEQLLKDLDTPPDPPKEAA